METIDRVKKLMAQSMPELELKDVGPESRIREELGLDSLSTMMIAIMVEDEFGFRFQGDIDFETVGELCSYIDEHSR